MFPFLFLIYLFPFFLLCTTRTVPEPVPHQLPLCHLQSSLPQQMRLYSDKPSARVTEFRWWGATWWVRQMKSRRKIDHTWALERRALSRALLSIQACLKRRRCPTGSQLFPLDTYFRCCTDDVYGPLTRTNLMQGLTTCIHVMPTWFAIKILQ